MKIQMKIKRRVSRRGFVGTVAGASMAAAQTGKWRSLSAEEAAIIEALSDCIIPADDHPGAKAAGVVRYIDRQLAGPLARFAPAYHAGIPAFDAAVRSATGKQFVALSADEQKRYLEKLGRNSFFDMVIDHTMQGFYGSPEHGGNAGGVSWKMLRIENLMDGHHQ